jgi:hypothetical protein
MHNRCRFKKHAGGPCPLVMLWPVSYTRGAPWLDPSASRRFGSRATLTIETLRF